MTNKLPAEGSGWAVVQDGKLQVSTVSPHRRAALVNWLVCNGVMVYQNWTDLRIEETWAKFEKLLDIRVVSVQVTEILQ
jgi:hypothetical protein